METNLLDKYMHKKSRININKIITKILISIALLLISLIYVKNNNHNLTNFKKYVFDNSFPFYSFNNLYQKIKGKEEIQPVSSNIKLLNNQTYLDGMSFQVSDSLVETLSPGIVVFIGKKEGFNETIIIQGSDGYDIWYGNLENINAQMYDYLNKNTIIGQTDTLYIKVMKDGKTVNVNEYMAI